MPTHTATAIAHPNIAFIKYWGNRDHRLRIPSNGSISMNLDGLTTRTTVTFDPALSTDTLTLNGAPIQEDALERVSQLLDRVREKAGFQSAARVASENNFPTGSGVASSASAFAALALASVAAAGLDPPEEELSRLARTGSGSACRSVPSGFVEWYLGEDHASSFAETIAPPDHWDLADCIAVVSREHKAVGSTGGHALADTSPLQSARLADAPRRLDLCRRAILAKDFDALADIVELDSNLMHAVMATSSPSLIYWLPATLTVIHAVRAWRREGLPACFTIDAGPNVHVITTQDRSPAVAQELRELPGVIDVLTAKPGGPARLD